jgi:hypothetical protein
MLVIVPITVVKACSVNLMKLIMRYPTTARLAIASTAKVAILFSDHLFWY